MIELDCGASCISLSGTASRLRPQVHAVLPPPEVTGCASRCRRWLLRLVFVDRQFLGRLALRRWNEGRPGHAGLRLVIALCRLRRGCRDHDEMVAARTLDLLAGELLVALDVLFAMRAGEFEFAHRLNGWMVD